MAAPDKEASNPPHIQIVSRTIFSLAGSYNHLHLTEFQTRFSILIMRLEAKLCRAQFTNIPSFETHLKRAGSEVVETHLKNRPPMLNTESLKSATLNQRVH